jgi:hypothetical protein
MKFTTDQVRALLPGFEVEEVADGIRAYQSRDVDSYSNLVNPIPMVLRAALSLRLEPDQFRDESEYVKDLRMGSSWTGEYGDHYIRFDVTFLFDPPPSEDSDIGR